MGARGASRDEAGLVLPAASPGAMAGPGLSPRGVAGPGLSGTRWRPGKVPAPVVKGADSRLRQAWGSPLWSQAA